MTFLVQSPRDDGGVLEKDLKDAEKEREERRKKEKELKDNQLHSIFPAGLPAVTPKSNHLVYDWKRTKGKERSLRDPLIKPSAIPLDDHYLGVLPESSSKVSLA
jgi:hypothetical protein